MPEFRFIRNSQKSSLAARKISEYQEFLDKLSPEEQNFGSSETSSQSASSSSLFLKVRNMATRTHTSHLKIDAGTMSSGSKVSSAHRRTVLESVPLIQELGAADVIGLHVRAHRKKQGLRIDDAAALTGVSVDLMSRLENGSGSVRLDKLMSVLDGLGLALVVVPKGHELLRHLPEEKVFGSSDFTNPAP